MFRNYLLIAWQNLARQKLFALINVAGLAIGLTVFILIFLYVKKEYSWDRHWQDADRIYWLTMDRLTGTNRNKNPFVPVLINDIITQNFSESIEKSARIVFRGGDIYVENERFNGNIFLTEKSILDIFDFEVISGSLEDTLTGPGRIALREEQAEQYFGAQYPIGKVISLAMGEEERSDYLVTAVFRIPEATSLIISSLSLLDDSDLNELGANAASWWNSGFGINYFVLNQGADIETLNQRLVDMVNTAVPKEPWRIMRSDEQLSDYYTFEFESLTEAHFSDYLGTGNTVDRNKVLVFALIGVQVLLMGSANFVILATAKAEDRRKEVGVRKVLGARRGQLMFQFLNESVLQTCAALLVAVFLVSLSLPAFGNLIGRELDFTLLSGIAVLSLIILAVSVGVMGGLYPALVLSSFNPVSVLRPSGRVFMAGYINARSAMACFQFTIAITLLVATLGVYFQLQHLRQLDPGFTTDNLFSVGINFQERQLMEPYINAVETLPGVEQVARSSRRPGPGGSSIIISGNYLYGPENTRQAWSGIWVDHAFFDTYDIQLLAGRVFDPDRDRILDRNMPAEERENYRAKIVVNNKFVQSLGLTRPEEAVGELVFNEGRNRDGEILRTAVEIIGVVEDSRFESLRELPESTVYLLTPDYTTVTVRYTDAAAGTIAQDLERVWSEVAPNTPFRGEFVSTVLAEEFRQEENEGLLMLSLALLSIFIAGMGMFALASYTIRRSVKEVGIRKVLGANSGNVIRLFLWRFSLPVLTANVVAWPVSLYVLLRWLQRFPDQIGYLKLAPICLLATVLALLVAWATVGLTTARAARANPVKSLRYE